MLDAMRLARRAPDESEDPAFSTAAAVAGQSDELRRQLLPFADKTKLTSPVTYPAANDPFPQHLAGSRRHDRRQAPIRCVALEASGEYDTHAGEGDGALERRSA